MTKVIQLLSLIIFDNCKLDPSAFFYKFSHVLVKDLKLVTFLFSHFVPLPVFSVGLPTLWTIF